MVSKFVFVVLLFKFKRLTIKYPSSLCCIAKFLVTVGSAKKFVRITSGFGGGEFTTLRKVSTCQQLKFAFLLLEYCKIRECYAVANAFTIRNMHSLLLYMNCNSRKINREYSDAIKLPKSYPTPVVGG
jgi:hypothetical protein